VATLVINADALAVRIDALPGAAAGRADRIHRLRAAVRLGQRAIAAAVAITWPGSGRA